MVNGNSYTMMVFICKCLSSSRVGGGGCRRNGREKINYHRFQLHWFMHRDTDSLDVEICPKGEKYLKLTRRLHCTYNSLLLPFLYFASIIKRYSLVVDIEYAAEDSRSSTCGVVRGLRTSVDLLLFNRSSSNAQINQKINYQTPAHAAWRWKRRASRIIISLVMCVCFCNSLHDDIIVAICEPSHF